MMLQNLLCFGLGVISGVTFLMIISALIVGSRADKNFNNKSSK